jgi:flagellar basal body rod protein FlgC
VRVSNVDYHTEMVNAMTAARAYEANVTVLEMTKHMAAATLRLIA